jgi:hypothetical protein
MVKSYKTIVRESYGENEILVKFWLNTPARLLLKIREIC